MNISLELLDLKNAQDIYDFEVENRAYFEENLPSRGEDYYVLENYNNIIEELIDEQNHGECFMYVIRNETGKVIGRINFVSVKNEKTKTAELGYRIGQTEIGKGIATRAVKMALNLGFERHQLDEVTAGTSTDNIASQKILEKNGFTCIGIDKNYMQLNGKQVDNVKYIKKLS